jgi:hypothetical protein
MPARSVEYDPKNVPGRAGELEEVYPCGDRVLKPHVDPSLAV